MPRNSMPVTTSAYNLLENEINTSKLLQRLQQATGQKSLADVATEAVEVGRLAQM